MTVGEVIADLSAFDPAMELRLAIEDGTTFTIGAIYDNSAEIKPPTTLFIDIDEVDE